MAVKIEEVRKTLSKQTTAQLIAKLEKSTLLGISYDAAIEILTKRGQDVSKFKKPAEVKSKVAVEYSAGDETAEKPAIKSKEKKTAAPKEKKEPKAKNESRSKHVGSLGTGTKVTFTPHGSDKKMTGTVLRCYAYDNKKGVQKEGVVVTGSDGAQYRKNIESVEVK